MAQIDREKETKTNKNGDQKETEREGSDLHGGVHSGHGSAEEVWRLEGHSQELGSGR